MRHASRFDRARNELVSTFFSDKKITTQGERLTNRNEVGEQLEIIFLLRLQ